MKRTIFNALIFTLVITLTSCSVNNDNTEPQDYRTLWHLVNVTGGVDGVDNDFELDDIIWEFDDETGLLSVTNTNTDDTIEDGLDSGTYSFSLSQDDTNYYMTIDGTELGAYNITTTDLVIDENITSEGTGADGYIYTFKRTLELIENE